MSATRLAFTIRALTADDLPLERQFVASLSDQDLRSRTLGSAQQPTDKQLLALLRARPPRHLGLAAIAGDASAARIIGVARYGPTVNRHRAQFAVVVAAEARRHGVARQLLHRLIDEAAKTGYSELEGETFAQNEAMLSLARSTGFRVEPIPSDRQLRRLSRTL